MNRGDNDKEMSGTAYINIPAYPGHSAHAPKSIAGWCVLILGANRTVQSLVIINPVDYWEVVKVMGWNCMTNCAINLKY